MFWKDAQRLRSLTLASGLSIKDLELAFYGSARTALEGAIDGSMRVQFDSDANYSDVKEWVEAGGDEGSFEPIQETFATDCVECHGSETFAAGNLELDSYEGVEPLLEADTGKSISRLIALSHAHLLSVSVVVFLLVFIFSFSSYPEWLKMVTYLVAFFAVFLDVGSWWPAKLAPFFSIFIIIGGAALLGTAFGTLSLLGLWDLWFGKAE